MGLTVSLMLSLVLTTSLAACERTTGTAPRTLDDAAIAAAVKAKLAEERVSTVAQIDVDTSAGVVELKGTVNSIATTDRAAEVARQVSGVRDVANNLTVRPFGG
jgi:hyperosmotically inducible periplasmic protein